MATTYEVIYNITANAQAAITTLTELEAVTSKFGAAAKQVTEMSTAIKSLNKSLGTTSTNSKIDIQVGKSLERLKNLAIQANATASALERVAALGGIGAARAVGGGRTAGKTSRAAASSATTGRARGGTARPTVVAPYGTGNPYSYTAPPGMYPSRSGRQSGYRPSQTVPRTSTSRIIPRNIAYRNLGPAFIDSGSGALDMVKGMGIMYGISGMGAMFGQAVSDYVNYNNIMTTTRGILGAHDTRANFSGRFAGMEKNIRNIGMRTKFTAPEVAEASKFLAMAGLSIDDINKAINPITDIALVADSDLGETADVVTNIMTAYRMQPDQMREVADKMTMAFTMSNTTLMEMAESYKYFASIAAEEGMDFTDVTAAIGLLGDAGLKGSHAGTTIRQIFNNLKKPTKNQLPFWKKYGVNRFDKNGKLRPLMDIFSDLSKAGALSDAFNMFRVTAAQGAVSLGASTEKWLKMRDAINNSEGISNQLAELRINNLEGLWKQIQSSFTEAAMQALADFEPQVTNAMRQLINWLQSNDGRSFVRELTGSLFNLMKSVGELTVTFVDMYRKLAPIINFWFKLQIILQAIIIPLRVIKGLINFALGGAAITQTFGKWTSSIGAFSKALSYNGISAGAAAFTTSMNNIAGTAESTANRVAAARNVINGTSSRPGVKTPLGYMYNGSTNTPAMQENWLRKRGMYEQMIFGQISLGPGIPNAAALQSMHGQIQANNARMAAIASSTTMFPWTKKKQLRALRTANSSIWRDINAAYQAVKPSDSQVNFARDQRELVTNKRYDALRKMDSLRQSIAAIKADKVGVWKKWPTLVKMERQLQIMQRRWGAGGVEMLANQAAYQYWTNQEIAARQDYERQMAVWNQANQARAKAGGPNQFYGRGPTMWQRIKGVPDNIKNWWAGRKNWGTNIKNWANNNPKSYSNLMGGVGAVAGIGGSILGGAIGNGDYSGMIWGTLASLAPMFISGGPVGWVVGAVAGIAAIGYEIYSMGQKAKAAREAVHSLSLQFNRKDGWLSGSSLTDAEQMYSFMHDKNLGINSLIERRVSLLRQAKDLEDAMSDKKDTEEWNATIRQSDLEGYEQVRNATNGWNKVSSLWGNKETGSGYTTVQEQLAELGYGHLLQFDERKFWDKSGRGKWFKADGSGYWQLPSGVTDKVLATHKAGFQSGFTNPSPMIANPMKRYEQEYNRLLAAGDLQGLRQLKFRVEDLLVNYRDTYDPTTRPDVLTKKYRELTPQQREGLYTRRQGTFERYRDWLDDERWNNIQNFLQEEQSGALQFNSALSYMKEFTTTRAALPLLRNYNGQVTDELAAAWQFSKDPNNFGFYDHNGVSGHMAAENFIQAYTDLQSFVEEFSKVHPLFASQGFDKKILEDLSGIYNIAKVQYENPDAFKWHAGMKLPSSGTQSLLSFDWWNQPYGNVKVPMYTLNQAGYKTSNGEKYPPKEEQKYFIFQLGGIKIDNVNGQLNADSIAGLNTAIGNYLSSTLSGIAETQFGVKVNGGK